MSSGDHLARATNLASFLCHPSQGSCKLEAGKRPGSGVLEPTAQMVVNKLPPDDCEQQSLEKEWHSVQGEAGRHPRNRKAFSAGRGQTPFHWS